MTDRITLDVEAETTADHRQTGEDLLDGDGHYARDADPDAVSLTDGIASIVTGLGGRIPVEFRAAVDNEGYARRRSWTVYAPAPNPYHVAAAVTDLLLDAGDFEVDVYVAEETAAETERRLRSRLGYLLDDERHIEEVVAHHRYATPTAPEELADSAGLQALDEAWEAAERPPEEARRDATTLTRHAHDAWDYYAVDIVIDEEADTPHWG